MPTVGSVSYNSQTITTTAITLESEFRYSVASGNSRVETWVNMDKDAEPQVETITVQSSLPGADAYYRVAIDGPTAGADRVFIYEFLTASTDTANTIASRLAELIDSAADVSAVASTNTVIITSVLPGTNGAFTATVSCLNKSDSSSVSSKIATTTTTAASGTGKVRKVAQFEVELGENGGKPQIRLLNGVWYNGAASPVSAGSFGPVPFSGPTTWDSLRAVS